MVLYVAVLVSGHLSSSIVKCWYDILEAWGLNPGWAWELYIWRFIWDELSLESTWVKNWFLGCLFDLQQSIADVGHRIGNVRHFKARDGLVLKSGGLSSSTGRLSGWYVGGPRFESSLGMHVFCCCFFLKTTTYVNNAVFLWTQNNVQRYWYPK